MFHKLYFKTWVRVPVKLAIMMAIIKCFRDTQQRWLLGADCPIATIPRMATEYGNGAQLIPYLPSPYPYYTNYKEYQNLKEFKRLNNSIVECYMAQERTSSIYVDHPFRQNSDMVDHFMQYGQQFRYGQKITYHCLVNKEEKEGSLPPGVYREVRLREQPCLDVIKPITPEL